MLITDPFTIANMHRSKSSHRRHSSSFTQFVARLQHTFSSKNTKASTPVVRTQFIIPLQRSTPLPNFPSFTHEHRRPPRRTQCRLAEILYDPTRQVEYLSEIDERSDSDLSNQSHVPDDNDSCYDSMSDHRQDRCNLSRMNVSDADQLDPSMGTLKLLKLPTTLNSAPFHSTAIHDVSQF